MPPKMTPRLRATAARAARESSLASGGTERPKRQVKVTEKAAAAAVINQNCKRAASSVPQPGKAKVSRSENDTPAEMLVANTLPSHSHRMKTRHVPLQIEIDEPKDSFPSSPKSNHSSTREVEHDDDALSDDDDLTRFECQPALLQNVLGKEVARFVSTDRDSTGSVCSKRDAARELERPAWRGQHNATMVQAANTRTSQRTLTAVADASEDEPSITELPLMTPRRKKVTRTSRRVEAEQYWSESCRLDYGEDGKVDLNAQQPHVRQVLHESVSNMEQHIFFENSYPDVTERSRVNITSFLATARKGDLYIDLRQRLQQDAQFVQAMSSVPDGRICKFRNEVRQIATETVGAAYGLTPGPNLSEKISSLLKDDTYIYGLDAQGMPNLKQPLRHPGIIETLKQACFVKKKKKLPVGERFNGHFTSTLDGHPELEIPPVMLSLTATVVHAALLRVMQATSGGVDSTVAADKSLSDINSSHFAGVYASYIAIIDELYNQSETKYHVFMLRYHTDVSSGSHNLLRAAIQSTIRRIDWAGMDDL
ncbi:hypothetical protein BDN67DRAFT_984795 [Paxillus ammoniavirescens]|nr:hypothetical protein BDN67DRAFT_984795 [Paxillus ammoniavirescens]